MAFIKMEKVKTALEIALETKTNLILHGPGGHGKSEFVNCFFKEKGINPFVKSLHGDIDEAELFGGIDFRRLSDKDSPEIKYFYERSFAVHKYVVFEELFDAPPGVLTALKDVLTAGEIRHGHFRMPIKTKVVIGLTNVSPAEISEMGAAYHALTERFPMQFEVKWETYTAGDFLYMFEATGTRHERSDLVAKLAEKAINAGHFVSPRTVMHANKICRNGHGYTGVQFIPGFDRVYPEVEEMEKALRLETAFRIAVSIRKDRLSSLPTGSPTAWLRKAATAKQFAEEIGEITVPDTLFKEREAIQQEFFQIAEKAQNAALQTAMEVQQ